MQQAKEAYECLDIMQQQIIDAAIIKKISRSVYEATLRIYETRSGKRRSNLSEIFDTLVKDYTSPEKITLLRGGMIGFGKDNCELPIAAIAELEEDDPSYYPGRIRSNKALELAEGGIRPECFDFIRCQLTPAAPVQRFMMASN